MKDGYDLLLRNLMIKMEQSECQSIKLEKIPLDRKLIRKVSRPFILKKKKNK